MSRSFKILGASSIVAFAFAFLYLTITHQGILYSPGINMTEIGQLPYDEATAIMVGRSDKISLSQYLAMTVFTRWFWWQHVQLWSAMIIANFLTVGITEIFISK